MGGDEKGDGRSSQETKRNEKEGFREYIEYLYDKGLEIGLGYNEMYDLETSSPNPCSFALTDTGFKIRRNYCDSITYYYMAV